MKTTRKRRSRAFWERHVRALASSGQTRRMYCRVHKLSRSTFDLWRRRIASEAAVRVVPAFVPLQMPSGPSHESLQLRCPGGASLSLPRDCDPAWLAQLLSGLR